MTGRILSEDVAGIAAQLSEATGDVWATAAFGRFGCVYRPGDTIEDVVATYEAARRLLEAAK